MRPNVCFWGGALLLAAALAGCASGADRAYARHGILTDYRVEPPTASQPAHPRALTRFTSDEWQGRLSPDGRYLAYVSNQKGNPDIWIKDLATGMPEPIAPHLAADEMPAFSPDGRTLAFVSRRDDVKGDIFLVTLDAKHVLTKLTDRTTADLSPVFAPDGHSLFLISGEESSGKLTRLWLDTRRRETLSEGGALQPAVSSDGAYAAYVMKDERGVNAVVVLRLADNKRVTLPSGGFQQGFPAFLPDRSGLAFVRFFGARPTQPLAGGESASVWRVPLAGLFEKTPEALLGTYEQLSSGATTHLFLQAHPQGLVYTSDSDGSLDIFIEPLDGLLPAYRAPAELLAQALAAPDLEDQLFMLRRLERFPDSGEYQEALYRAGQLYVRAGAFENGRDAFDRLLAMPKRQGEWQGLARVDRAVFDVEMTHTREAETGIAVSESQIAEALDAVKAAVEDESADRVLAYARLREGDLHAYRGEDQLAMDLYQEVVRRFPAQRELAVRARIRLGRLLNQLDDGEAQLAYFLNLFAEYPDNERYQRDIAKEMVALLEGMETRRLDGTASPRGKQGKPDTKDARDKALQERVIERLRVLVDRHPEQPLLGAILTREIGARYLAQNEHALAIAALNRLPQAYPQQTAEVASAVFALGEAALKQAAEYRRAGRFGEAAELYDTTLDQFERVARLYPAGSDLHARAARQFSAMALLKAGQEEADGDVAAAQKTFARLLAFDPDQMAAHRHLIALGVRQGHYADLRKRYERWAEKAPTNATAHYALGYLYTWRERLSKGDLDDAESELRQALGLNSQSPYIYMTLGWVAEMRERYTGDFVSGWLEEAIDTYDKAYRLNDRRADPQAEADILLNLGNAFAQLGNTWARAYDLFGQREALALPFQSPIQEALFHITFGRAAFNLDRYDEAARHFETALLLARTQKRGDIEADCIARLALNAQALGQYETSTRYFERSIEIYRTAGKLTALAALTRAMALNDMALGERPRALKHLDESRALLERYGTMDVGDFSRFTMGGIGLSLAPRGFSRTHERDVNVSLNELLLEDAQRFREAAARLDTKEALTKALQAERLGAGSMDDSGIELDRERMVIAARRAVMAAERGDMAAAVSSYREAYERGEHIQAKPLEDNGAVLAAARTPQERAALLSEEGDGHFVFVLSGNDFEAQARAVTGGAEALLRALARGEWVEDALLQEWVARLDRVERRREFAERGGEPVLRLNVRWKLANALGALGFEEARRFEAARTGGAEETATGSFARLLNLTTLLSQGVRLNLETARATSARAADQPPLDPALYDEDNTPYARLRVHLQALLNAAELGAFAETPEQRKQPSAHSNKALAQAEAVCGHVRVPDLCSLVRVRLALAQGQTETAAKEADAYLSMPPWLLGQTYADAATELRHAILDAVLDDALARGDAGAAWRWSEAEAQRSFQDAVATMKLGADGKDVRAALAAIEQAARAYTKELEAQSIDDTPADAMARHDRLTSLEQAFRAAIEPLRQTAPKVAQLFAEPDAAATDAWKTFVGEKAALVRLLARERSSWLLSFDAAGAHLAQAHLTASEWREPVHAQAAAEALQSAAGQAHEIYLDTHRLDPWLLPSLPSNATLSRFASVAALLQAYEQRKTPAPALRVASDAEMSWPAGISPLEPQKDASLWQSLAQPERLVLSYPLVHQGKSAANWWVAHHDESEPFTAHLDALWRADWLWLDHLDPAVRDGESWLCLERWLAWVGASASVWMPPAAAATPAPALGALAQALATKTDRLALQATEPALLAHPIFVGYNGMTPEEARGFAKNSLLPSVQQAVAFQQKGLARQAVAAYERTLSFIAASGEEKFLDKALEMLVDQRAALGDFEEAIRVQQRVLARAEAAAAKDLTRTDSVYKAKHTLARFYSQLNRTDDALRINKEILDAQAGDDKTLDRAYTLGQRGLILEVGGRYSEALENDEAAYRLYVEAKDIPGQLAQARNAARLLRQRLSAYGRAEGYLQRALSLANGGSDPLPAMLLRLELARNAASLGRYAATLEITKRLVEEAHEQADKLIAQGKRVLSDTEIKEDEKNKQLRTLKSQKEQMDAIVLQAKVESVNTRWLQGQYSEALSEQDEAIQLALKAKDVSKQIILNNAKALVYASLGDTPQAVTTLKETLRMAHEQNDRSEQAIAYNNLGDTYRKAGQFEAARQAFMQALEIDSQQHDKLGLAYDYANLGRVYENLGRYEDAVESSQHALAMSRELGHPVNEIKSQLCLGHVYLAQGKAKESRAALESGLARATALGLSEWEWKLRLALGRTLVKLGAQEEALAQFTEGIARVESKPAEVRLARASVHVEDEKNELYDEALSVLATLGRSEEAFLLSERERARVFLDMAGAAGLARSPAEEAALKSANEAAQAWREAQDAWRGAKSDEQAERAAAMEQAQARYTEALHALAAVNAELPSYVHVAAPHVQDLQAALEPGTLLLRYHAAPTQLIVWALTREGLRMERVAITRTDLERLVGRYREMLLHFGDVSELGQELSRRLVTPMKSDLKSATRVLIVASGPLHVVPFAALKAADGAWLGDTVELGYLGSAAELLIAKRAPAWELNASDRRVAVGLATSDEANTPALPFTRHEVMSIGRAFPGTLVLLDSAASEAEVRRLLPQAAWLHVAAHTHLDDVHPFESALLLRGGAGEDGALRLSEIIGQGLKAKLIVLSACDSAVGPLDSDAMLGFGRAFLSAGAARVLASQWRVADLATAVLMKHFYRQLKTLPPAAALQAAQKAVREQFPHPAYWAGFRLEGRLD